MRALCRLASVALFSACAIFASASPIDFKSNVLDPPPPTVTFPTYTISASPFVVQFSGCVAGELPNGLTADGCFSGLNRTGLFWTALQFVFPNTPVLNSQTPDCSPAPSNNIFQTANCGYDAIAYTLVFSNGVLPNDDLFFLTETGVPPALFPTGIGTVLSTTATTPEPAPFLLLASGLAVTLFAWRLHR